MQNKSDQNLSNLEAVLEKYQGLVYSIIYGITLDSNDTWDLTQEVFLKAHICTNFFEKEFKQKSWLVTVARNEALKYKRSFKRKFNYMLRYCGIQDCIDSSALEEKFIRDESVSELNKCLTELDDEARQIVTLRYSADLSYKEIAELMDLKIGTVMSRLSRTKEKLGILMENNNEN